MTYYTYLFIDPKTNKEVYVGKGKELRWKDHYWPRAKSHIANLIRKRRKEDYDMTPIIYYETDEQTALIMEQFWIDFFGRKDLGKGTLFNLTDGGDGTTNMTSWNKGISPSEETKEKIREKRKLQVKTNKGQKFGPISDEHKNALRIANSRPKSEETIRRMSAARLISNNTPEFKLAHSERMKQWWADRKIKEASNV